MFFNLFKKQKTLTGEMLFSKNISLNMDTRTTLRNCNALIVGSLDTPKQSGYIIPNLQQHICSYVVIDTDGTIQNQTEQMFRDNGYEIKVLDVAQPENSNRYNPFHYLRSDTDILDMVNTLVKNFDNRSLVHTTAMLSKARTALLQALVFYLYKEFDVTAQTMESVAKLLDCAKTRFGERGKTALDIMFEALKTKDPEHMAVRSYDVFRQLTNQKSQMVVADLSCNLTMFKIKDYACLTSHDTLDIPYIGQMPTVLYVHPCILREGYYRSPENETLLPLFFTQLFETLYYTAETQGERKILPVHVRILFNDFGAYGLVPSLPEKLSTVRPYHISCDILMNNCENLKTMYPDEWRCIVSNCDTLVYLADDKSEPLELVSELIDKTNDKMKTAVKRRAPKCPAKIRRGAKPLKTTAQLAALKKGDCVVYIRGCIPFVDKVCGAPSYTLD